MKIMAVRQSGAPFHLDMYDAYHIEFKERYDEILKECGTDMMAVHSILEMLDNEMASKYDTETIIKLPASKKAIKKFVEDYGTYMISTHVETGDPILVLLDMGI